VLRPAIHLDDVHWDQLTVVFVHSNLLSDRISHENLAPTVPIDTVVHDTVGMVERLAGTTRMALDHQCSLITKEIDRLSQ
jgi:hypothetical protein